MFSLLLVGGLLASFLLVFTFDGFRESRENVVCVIDLLVERGYGYEQILNVLRFYGVMES